MKYVIIFESVGSTGVDGVEDHHRGHESHETFSKDAMFRFGPFLDPIALFLINSGA
jgi:hypothetical protein